MASRAGPIHAARRSAALVTATALVVGSGWFGASRAYADTTPPPAPANFRVSPSPTSTDGRVVLTWNPSPAQDVAYYQIFRYNGTGTPTANELAYIGRTEDTRNYFIDNVPTEGSFRYAVMAMDTSNNDSPPSSWASITVDLPANGSGTVSPDLTPPSAVTGLTVGSPITGTRAVVLTWSPHNAPDFWRYLVYRASGAEVARMVAYVTDAHSFTDAVPSDGAYSYYVLAQDKPGNASPISAVVTTEADTTAPVVQITAPVAGQAYLNNLSLSMSAAITESGSGYDAGAVRYYLDDSLLTSPTINLGTVAAGSHRAKVTVTDRAGNMGSDEVTFDVTAQSADPGAPQNLTAPAYSQSRSVTLAWSAPLSGTVTQYEVYRNSAGTLALAGTTLPAVTQFTDTVSTDGTYSYFVAATNGTLAAAASQTVVVQVDTVAPAITVASPEANKRYEAAGTLPVQVSIADSGSGYDLAQVRLYLDGTLFTAAGIDLGTLHAGNHSFQVAAGDRAGNQTIKTVLFSVGEAADDDDDDDDDDDGDDGHRSERKDLIELLSSLRLQVHHGHYNALMAKARNGNLRSFVHHVAKFRGKFISRTAADKLLEAVGDLSQTSPRR